MLADEPSVLDEGPLVLALVEDRHHLEALRALFVEAGYRFEGALTLGAALAAQRESVALLLVELGQGCAPLDALLAAHPCHGLAQGLALPTIALLEPGASASLALNALECGAHEVLRRPIAPVELLARVSAALTRARAARQLHERLADAELAAQLAAELIASPWAATAPTARVVERLIQHRGGWAAWLGADPDRGHLLDAAGAPLSLGGAPQVRMALARRQIITLDASLIRDLGLAPAAHQQPWDDPRACLIPVGSALWPERLWGALIWSCDARSHAPSHAPSHARTDAWPGSLEGALERAAALGGALRASLTLAIDQRALLKQRDEARAQQAALSDHAQHTDALLERLLEASPGAVVAADAQGRICLFNPRAQAILGYSLPEALGMDVRRLYPEGVARALMQQLRAQGGQLTTRVDLVDRRGQLIPVELSARQLLAGARQVGSLGVFTDLRDTLALEHKLELAADELEHSRERLVLAQLAGAASHEINQPLTSLLGYAELLAARLADAEPLIQRAVAQIGADAQRIAQTVRDLSGASASRTRGYVGQARILDLRPAPDLGQPPQEGADER